MNNSNNNNFCGSHNRCTDFICYDCNVLMCAACASQHSRHNFEHIDNIKSYINNITVDTTTTTNSDNDNSNSTFSGLRDIQSSIKSTFDTLKSKVKEYEQLQQTENEISSKFKELHDFLVVEEHKLKAPIIDGKTQLEQQIDKQIIVMKSLNSINNRITNTQPNDKNLDQADSQSSSSISPDIVESYQISTIITSISQSSNHNEFIQNNKNTVFYLDDSNKLNRLDKDDSSILNILLENNSIIKLNSVSERDQQLRSQQYKLIVKNEQINLIKNQIQSSIKLELLNQPYIFSTDMNGKISIINIKDPNNIHFEQIKIEMTYSFPPYNSNVNVGDFIYMFGGAKSRHSIFTKYSVRNRSLETNEMRGVDKCAYISACYDGLDHIYLFDGYKTPKANIYRYNINSSTFEKYSTINLDGTCHHFTFFFKDFIYVFTPAIQKILKFDINNKSTIDLPIGVPKYTSRGVCTDGNGNIYVQSELGLHRINIETNEIKIFDNSKINTSYKHHNLIYHSIDDQSYIYSLLGKDRNFIFSIENGTWEKILQDDQSDRSECASTLYRL
ncbi:hypothetical protein PPL_04091 [Heterostelium album PN500]|uniref:B box-type domain-containing protein n=1 Tax=Heterostelium pallidum (strain ATCC 26659 / Pp 5 / PN500) TaxID=670386 RepID=D3B603_HETP5|nr:hypothetical protein PPL_04091 [Heterostelium album PN500]EFA83301.1 hypothetical protein PPL_04091 [Heterostelium album PN500]|eukprot:XP_020435418.1 hypothetical protein PPL_04091 [Heterostelium album PN500]